MDVSGVSVPPSTVKPVTALPPDFDDPERVAVGRESCVLGSGADLPGACALEEGE